jgi:hypothetical protein
VQALDTPESYLAYYKSAFTDSELPLYLQSRLQRLAALKVVNQSDLASLDLQMIRQQEFNIAALYWDWAPTAPELSAWAHTPTVKIPWRPAYEAARASRHLEWYPRILKAFEKGATIVAVGLDHVWARKGAGAPGLLQLLQDDGFTVKFVGLEVCPSP